MSDTYQVRTSDYSGIGMVATIIYLVIVLVIIVLGREKFLEMAPNSWGDFLAGVFGPVALGWVVISTFQQREELRQNTRALNFQVEELKASVKQQTEIAEANKKMIELDIEKTNQTRMPKLVMAILLGRHEPDKIMFKLEILNIGYTATNVTINPVGLAYTIGNNQFAYIAQQEKRHLDFELPDLTRPVRFHVHYRDGFSKGKQQIFKMIRGEGNALVIFEIEEFEAMLNY